MSSESALILDPGCGDLLLYPALFRAEAARWYAKLREQVRWQQESAMIYRAAGKPCLG